MRALQAIRERLDALRRRFGRSATGAAAGEGDESYLERTARAAVKQILSPLDYFVTDLELPDSPTALKKRIKWIITIRYVVSPSVVALMFFTGWQGLTQSPAMTRSAILAVLLTGAIAVGLNVAYQLALKRHRDLKQFVFLQLAVDIVLFTSYVYRSGGITSPFTFLFLLPIIAAAILVSGRAAASLAALATICHTTVALLAATGAIDHISYFVALDNFAQKWSYVVLMLLMNAVAFFAVAALSSGLTRAVRSKTDALADATLQLDRRAQLLEMLYRVARTAVDTSDSREAVDHIGEILVRGLDLDRVLIYLVSEDGTQLELVRRFDHPRLLGSVEPTPLQVTIPLREDAGLTARCALTREPENVKDPAAHPLINRELAERIGINPFAVAPMVAKGHVLGVLGVDRGVDLGVIDDEAFQVLIAFADQAAAALRTAQLERTADPKSGADETAEPPDAPGAPAPPCPVSDEKGSVC